MVRVLLQRSPQLAALRLVEQVRAQPGGTDRVRLGHDHVLALQEAAARSGEAERQQQAEEPEDGALHGAELRARGGVARALRVAAAAEADLERREQEREQGDRDAQCEPDVFHQGLHSGNATVTPTRAVHFGATGASSRQAMYSPAAKTLSGGQCSRMVTWP